MTQIPVGTVIGRLTTVREPFLKEGRGGRRRSYVSCRCSCGTEKDIQVSHLRTGRTQSCGCLQREKAGLKNSGEEHHAWTGGRYTEKSGYVRVYVKGSHPRYKRYALEHVLIMEDNLGRYLLPGENVHHKNGVRDDNRPDNLELWVTSQPPGQRPEDLLVWADEIIRRYRRAE